MKSVIVTMLGLCVLGSSGVRASETPAKTFHPIAVSDEDLLYQEALKIGLNQGLRHSPEEGTSRKILIDQMRLLLSRPEREEKISEAEIRRYYHDHRERFRVPSQVSFRQIFLAHAKSETENKILIELRSGKASWKKIENLSDPHPLGLEFKSASEEFLSRRFGPGFFSALRHLKVHQWSGPIQSPLGTHFVHIDQRTSSEIAPLSSVRLTIIAAISKEHSSQRLRQAIRRLSSHP